MLQWGRNILVAERRFGSISTLSIDQLQWGRNILVAESPEAPSVTDRNSVASMGPQHTRCGKLADMEKDLVLLRASMGPQHTRCGKAAPALLGGRGGGVASMGPQHTRCGKKSGAGEPTRYGGCFNGAATYSLRKVVHLPAQLRPCLASMGPQHTRCGKAADGFEQALPEMALQWGRNILVAESTRGRGTACCRSCFNGAATYSLRKAHDMAQPLPALE